MASGGDLQEISLLISKDFPYVKRGPGKFREMVAGGQVVIFKAVEGGKIAGFSEVQFIGGEIARINGLSVKESLQGKGIGAKLLDHTIKFLKGQKVERIVLLVKQSNERAKAIYKDLQKSINCYYDEKSAVGRRYRRQDEAGTPFCITVDGQTAEDNTVTVRERDSMEQLRVNCDKIRSYLWERLGL